MRILRRKLSKEEAILVCERIKLVAIIKPRLFEILDLECDPKDDPRAQRLFGILKTFLLLNSSPWIPPTSKSIGSTEKT